MIEAQCDDETFAPPCGKNNIKKIQINSEVQRKLSSIISK